jgi:hypothetical protein
VSANNRPGLRRAGSPPFKPEQKVSDVPRGKIAFTELSIKQASSFWHPKMHHKKPGISSGFFELLKG